MPTRHSDTTPTTARSWSLYRGYQRLQRLARRQMGFVRWVRTAGAPAPEIRRMVNRPDETRTARLASMPPVMSGPPTNKPSVPPAASNIPNVSWPPPAKPTTPSGPPRKRTLHCRGIHPGRRRTRPRRSTALPRSPNFPPASPPSPLPRSCQIPPRRNPRSKRGRKRNSLLTPRAQTTMISTSFARRVVCATCFIRECQCSSRSLGRGPTTNRSNSETRPA